VNSYQSKLASLKVPGERRMTKLDASITDVFSASLETHGRQAQLDETALDGMSAASSLKITPARKRTQTSEDINLSTRKSVRLAGKNA